MHEVVLKPKVFKISKIMNVKLKNYMISNLRNQQSAPEIDIDSFGENSLDFHYTFFSIY